MKYKLKMMKLKQGYRLTELAYESKLRDLRVDIHLKNEFREVAK